MLVVFKFVNYEQSYYKYPHEGFYVNITFPVPLGQSIPKAQLLDYVLRMINVIRNCQLSSKVAVPFCIPTSNEWEFLLLLALLMFQILAILTGVMWYLIAVFLMCFSFVLHFTSFCKAPAKLYIISFIQSILLY